MVKKRIFSGMQPSGNLTLGNYLGALKHWVALQHDYDCFFCIVDLHALTVPQDPIALRHQTLEVAAMYIACGLDPAHVTIFLQSQVSAHAELGWLLTCMSPLGWLQRMTQFKDKMAKQQQDSVSAGLLTYPALMAADILLYQTHLVPVGEDQRQHLEYTRDLAQRFNASFGEVFTIPEAMIPFNGARIMGLDNPLKKMSKSETAEGHAIYLTDSADQVKKKVMRAVTDSYAEVRFDESDERAGVRNLLTILMTLTDQTREQVEAQFVGRGYGDLKKAVVEAINTTLDPVRDRYRTLMGDQSELMSLLHDAAMRAREEAQPTLNAVRDRLGLMNLDAMKALS
ncbi:MAG: tryptophan--tRNA ligase [Anaerolineae bacterium]